jgi:hypothetical protein
VDYQIKSLGQECAATGEPLMPGSVCHCVLVRDGEGSRRLDFSRDGWTGPPEGTVGHWTRRVPAADTTPRPRDPDDLMQYFERLHEEANPTREGLRFVLALLLVRKRRLEIEETRPDDDGDLLVLTGTRGEGRFEVRDPRLDADEIERLQGELDAHLMVEGS